MASIRTAMLMAAMTALFMGIGALLGGQQGMIFALVIAAGMNLFTWWNSDKAVLRMNNARPVSEAEAPDLVRMVRQMVDRAGMPMPAVYVISEDQPNAFATGRNPENAAVAVTTGLMARLTREELAGVVAHELAHIRHRDTLLMTVTATFAGAISMLANFAMFFGGSGRDRPLGPIGGIVVMIFAPMAAAVVQMAISRTREYAADRGGAEICGNPLWLASALGKIEAFASRIDNPVAERNPATAHMFIINPLHAFARDRLFSTHPSTASRIAALQELAAAGGPPARDLAGMAAGLRDDDPAPSGSRVPSVPRRRRTPWN